MFAVAIDTPATGATPPPAPITVQAHLTTGSDPGKYALLDYKGPDGVWKTDTPGRRIDGAGPYEWDNVPALTAAHDGETWTFKVTAFPVTGTSVAATRAVTVKSLPAA